MAESIPLTKLIRASRESITVDGTAPAVLTAPGRAAETPRLDSVPTKKFPIVFIILIIWFSLKLVFLS